MSGAGPIPHSAIRKQAVEYGAEAHTFTACMIEMDKAYLNAIRPLKEGEHRVMKTPLKPGALKAAMGK